MTRCWTRQMGQCARGRGPSRASAGLSLGDLLLWGAGIGHAVLGALFVAALVTSRR